LGDFSGKARHNNQTLARDLNQTLDMMARTEDSRSVRNVQYVERLVDFADQVEAAIRADDLPRLARQTSELRGFAESIELDSQDAFARLRKKMIEIQLRLHEVELPAISFAAGAVTSSSPFSPVNRPTPKPVRARSRSVSMAHTTSPARATKSMSWSRSRWAWLNTHPVNPLRSSFAASTNPCTAARIQPRLANLAWTLSPTPVYS
jgi:hypothetical protein